MMKLLRNAVPPNETEVVTFGRYRGWMFKEVHEEYLDWAQKEVKANPGHSPDLARLARWAGSREPAPTGGYRGGDPESSAVVPVPKLDMAKPKAKPKALLTSPPCSSWSKAQRTSRTRPIESADDSGSFEEVDLPVEQQIRDMESRLVALKAQKDVKDRSQSTPRTPR